MSSLYERIGGEDTVSAAVDVFYERVLADDRLAHFFEGVDPERQVGKQRAFLTMAFGGPKDDGGRDLRAAHAPLVERGLEDVHVDVVLEHLVASLESLDVPEELVAEAALIAEGLRDDVLGRDATRRSA